MLLFAITGSLFVLSAPGLWYVPDGHAAYQFLLDYHLGFPQTGTYTVGLIALNYYICKLPQLIRSEPNAWQRTALACIVFTIRHFA